MKRRALSAPQLRLLHNIACGLRYDRDVYGKSYRGVFGQPVLSLIGRSVLVPDAEVVPMQKAREDRMCPECYGHGCSGCGGQGWKKLKEA